MRNSRTLISIAVAATFLLGACGSSTKTTDNTTAESTLAIDTVLPDTTTAETVAESSPETSAAVVDTVADSATVTDASSVLDGDSAAAALAAGFKGSTGSDMSPEQATCVTKAILGAYSEEELVNLGKSGFDALSDADKARAVGSFQKCPGVLESAILSGFKQSLPDLDDAQGQCAATAIGKAFTADEMVKFSTEPATASSTESLRKIFGAFQSCDGLLESLLASGMKSSGATETQAMCGAKALIKELGVDGIVEMSSNANNMPDEMKARVASAMKPCQ